MSMKYRKNIITRIGSLFLWTIMIAGFFNAVLFAAQEPKITDYEAQPVILSSTVKPHVLIIQDTSTSMLQFAYIAESSYSGTTIYDGIFKNKNYQYDASNNYFYVTANIGGLVKGRTYWEGSFLNWLCMRRIDVAKIALTGGLYSVISGSTVLRGEPFGVNTSTDSGSWDTDQSSNYDGTTRPYNFASSHSTDVGDDFFTIGSGTTKYYIRAKLEDGDTQPSGIIQQLGAKVEFGLERFDESGDADGGKILSYINTDDAADRTNIINNLVAQANGLKAALDDVNDDNGVSTPPAEAFCSAIGYFTNDDSNANCGTTRHPKYCGPKYHTNDYELGHDPFNGSAGSCIQSFVILITDGNANSDNKVTPAYISSTFTGDYVSGSDDLLDNVAYYAHVNDLRGLTGTQNLTSYVIYTFGGDASAVPLLKATAKGGGFDTSKGDTQPTAVGVSPSNWDKNGDGVPDNYYEATSSNALIAALNSALTNILGNVSSGTALSLLSTNTKAGQSTAIQAYYRPSISNSTLTWAGYLQGYWLDDRYNVREDSDHDKRLDYTKDNIITFFLDVNNDTKVHRIPVSGTSPYGDVNSMTTIDLSGTSPLWDAGERLHQRLAAERKIFTVIGGTNGSYDTSTNAVSDYVKRFDATNATSIQPYLGIADDDTWKDLGDTVTNRVTNLINWISGDETIVSGSTPDMRSRAINGDVWKLGDIIDANPVAVGDPQQQYDVLYSDLTYTEFRQFIQAKQRETIVYAGANDGMLHAFTTWRYNSGTTIFENPGSTPELLGDELWAYIPQALLPHLKWLADKNYKHVYYVDLTPVIMDVRIFEEDAATHPKGWGTILIGGFNWGGKHIQATGDFGSGTETRDFYPSFFCLDITDPRKPRVLWERTYTNLGLTTSSPSILRITDASGKNGNTWFAAFGSGPADYTDTVVTLDQSARIFVINPLDGNPYRNSGNDWLKDCTLGKKGYMNSPVSFDKFLDYNVDAIYFGETYNDSSSDSNPNWKGKIWKLSIPGIPPLKENNPTSWNRQEMLDFDAPITGSVSIGVGYHNTPYVFFGTGRYMEQKDKGYIAAQYLVGLVDHEDTIIRNFNDFTFPGNGWYYSLVGTGERSLTKPAVYAGAAVFTTFIPSSDICGFGGNGNLCLNDFFNGNLLTHVDLGVGNPSAPIIRPTSGGGRTHIDILGLPPGTGDNTGTAIAQSSTGVILKIPNLPFPKISRNKFTYWREP